MNDYDLKNRPSQRKLVKEALELLEDLLLKGCLRFGCGKAVGVVLFDDGISFFIQNKDTEDDLVAVGILHRQSLLV